MALQLEIMVLFGINFAMIYLLMARKSTILMGLLTIANVLGLVAAYSNDAAQFETFVFVTAVIWIGAGAIMLFIDNPLTTGFKKWGGRS